MFDAMAPDDHNVKRGKLVEMDGEVRFELLLVAGAGLKSRLRV